MSIAILHFNTTCYCINLSHLNRNNLYDKQSFMIQFPAIKPQDKQPSEQQLPKKRRKKLHG